MHVDAPWLQELLQHSNEKEHDPPFATHRPPLDEPPLDEPPLEEPPLEEPPLEEPPLEEPPVSWAPLEEPPLEEPGDVALVEPQGWVALGRMPLSSSLPPLAGVEGLGADGPFPVLVEPPDGFSDPVEVASHPAPWLEPGSAPEHATIEVVRMARAR